MKPLLCNCCHAPLAVVPVVDVDLGEVCEDCKVHLRWASAGLKQAGLRLCSHHAEAQENRAWRGSTEEAV